MPNTERIEDIIDIAKVEGQVQKTLELVEKVSAAIKNVKPMADMFKDSSGIANTKKSYDDLAKATQTVNQHQTELSLSIKEYQKLQDQIAQQAAKINALESDAAKTLAERREQQRQLNQEIKNTAIVNAAAEGSIQKMRAELNLLTQAYDKMSQAQRNSTQGQSLKTQIEGQVNALKTLEAETGRFQRNVGNYTGAISILEKSLTQIRQKMDDLTKSGQGNSTEVEKLQKEHDLLNQILNRQTQGFTSLTMEVRANEKALATMFAEGMQGTEAFRELEAQIAGAKREIKEFQASQQVLSSTAPGITAAMTAARGLAGAYALGAGAASLFADGDEKVQKELSKLVAVMTILQGLTEVHEFLEKRVAIAKVASAAATNIQTIAQRIWTATMLQSTGATIAFRIALVGLTGGLLLLAPLVAFGFGKLNESAKKAGDSMEDLQKRQELLNEAIGKGEDAYVSASKDISDLKDAIDLAKNGIVDKQKVVEEYNSSVGKTMGTVKSLSEVEQELSDPDRVKAYVDMMLYKAAANYALEEASKKAFEAEQKRNADAKTFGGIGEAPGSMVKQYQEEERKRQIEGIEKDENNLEAIAKRFHEKIQALASKYKFNPLGNDGGGGSGKAVSDQNKYLDEIRKANFDAQRLQLEQEIKFAQDYVQNDKNSFNTRLEAAQRFYNVKLQLIKGDRQFGLDDIDQKEAEAVKAAESEKKGAAIIQKIHENAAAQRKLTEVKYNLDILALNDESEKMTNAMTEKNLEQRKKLHEQYKAEEEAHRKSEHEIELENLANDYQSELAKLDESFASKKIKEKKYNEEKLRLQEEYQVAALRADIKFAQETILIAEARAKASGKQEDIDAVAAAKTKLATLQINLEGIIASFHVKKNKEQEDSDDALWKKREDRLQRYATLAKEVSDVVGGFIQNNVDKEKNALQAKEDQLNKTYETEVTNINNSTLTEEQKAARLKIIEAQKMAQTEAIERRKRQLDLERARFDKAANIANIISDTALAVVRALGDKTLPAPLRIPFAIAIGAIGAANLVKAIAAPLPKFAGGTKSSPEGWALTDELGPELYRTPSGKTFFGDNQPTFRFLEKGTEIIPHDRINDILHKRSMDSTLSLISHPVSDNTAKAIRSLENSINHQTLEMKKVMARQKAPRVVIHNHAGWNDYLRKQVFE